MSSSVTIPLGKVDLQIFLRRLQQEGWTIETNANECWLDFPADEKAKKIFEETGGIARGNVILDRNTGEEVDIDISQAQWGRHILRIYGTYKVTTADGKTFLITENSDGTISARSPDPDFTEGVGAELERKVEEIGKAAKIETGLHEGERAFVESAEKHGRRAEIVDQSMENPEMMRTRLRVQRKRV